MRLLSLTLSLIAAGSAVNAFTSYPDWRRSKRQLPNLFGGGDTEQGQPAEPLEPALTKVVHKTSVFLVPAQATHVSQNLSSFVPITSSTLAMQSTLPITSTTTTTTTSLPIISTFSTPPPPPPSPASDLTSLSHWKLAGITLACLSTLAVLMVVVNFHDQITQFLVDVLPPIPCLPCLKRRKQRDQLYEDFVPDWDKRSWEVRMKEEGGESLRYPGVASWASVSGGLVNSNSAMDKKVISVAPGQTGPWFMEGNTRYPFTVRPPIATHTASPNIEPGALFHGPGYGYHSGNGRFSGRFDDATRAKMVTEAYGMTFS